MKHCKNCGKKIEIDTNFCSNCGNKIIYKQYKQLKNENIIDGLEIRFIGLTLFFMLLYVFLSCGHLATSSNVDGSVSGLYILVGVPFGFIICGLSPSINYFIYRINTKKHNKILYILEIFFNVISIFSLFFFHNSFLSGNVNKDILFYINLLLPIVTSIIIILNLVAHTKTTD